MDRFIPTDQSGALRVSNATLNHTYSLIRDAPLSGATQLYQTIVILYTENPLVSGKLPIAEATIILLTYSIIVFTRTKIRVIYSSNRKMVSKG
ncbi:MAG: hypothetical protein LBI18_02855 [Planctomycetaceae bacterium]|jgi:hypothetical protein|nr:hypothetical protein [Planctomycetaceae bacterium]